MYQSISVAQRYYSIAVVLIIYGILYVLYATIDPIGLVNECRVQTFYQYLVVKLMHTLYYAQPADSNQGRQNNEKTMDISMPTDKVPGNT